MKTMEDVGVEIQLEEDNIWLDRELVDGGWKTSVEEIEAEVEKGVKNQRIEEYGTKEQQSKLYREQEQECHVCLSRISTLGKRQRLYNFGANGGDKIMERSERTD